MVRPRDHGFSHQLTAELQHYNQWIRPLPGLLGKGSCEAFVAQLIESLRRIQYVTVLQDRDISPRRKDPHDDFFDPLKAALLFIRAGELEEAFWMVFYFVHFGKHKNAGWRYAREVYGPLESPTRWDWVTTSADPSQFRLWLDAHKDMIARPGVPRGFGNHRKYQSLDAYSVAGTGNAFDTYIKWVAPPRTHQQLFTQAYQNTGNNPRQAFHDLYNSMSEVASFGRTARFDYLTMIGKLNLAPIEPGHIYLTNSTGPIQGARLLFGGQSSTSTLDQHIVELGEHLNIRLQALEDALCNWQKSPRQFKPFRL